MVNDGLIELGNANVKIAVQPKAGASLAYFKANIGDKEVDIMRPATAKALTDSDAAGSSMYPMLPYVNRIHDGFFVYWGIKRQVPSNVSSNKEPFDGDGWKFSWNVKEKSDKKVVLTTVGDPKKGFPFSYEAEVTYTLTDSGFNTHIMLRNLGILPMPCAMGVHPFFPKTKDVNIKFKAKNVWEHLGTPLRDKPYNVTSDWRFEEGKDIAKMTLDTCFGGFDGDAEITWPSNNVRLKIKAYEEFNHSILVVSENKNIFSFEPVTSAIDAFNLASRGIMGTGIKSIGPGETIEATVEFSVEEL